MPRTAREAPAGIIFHVLNRGVGRRGIFEKDEDFAAFERVMAHALRPRSQTRRWWMSPFQRLA